MPVLQGSEGLWCRGRRAAMKPLRVMLGVVLVAAACSDATASVDAAQRPRGAALQPSSSVPRLVVAPSRLTAQCLAAAARLGFSVPCPGLVPSRSGRALSCPAPVGAGASTSCVGVEGLAQYPIFFLEFTRFDVARAYVGVDGQPDGHLTVEGRRPADDPLEPCIGGVNVGTVKVGTRVTTEYVCPNGNRRVEREARHGEGVYVGHLALAWSQRGIAYIASAHGHTTANLVLLKRLVGSIRLIPPANAPP
jgi:hypothetical protein